MSNPPPDQSPLHPSALWLGLDGERREAAGRLLKKGTTIAARLEGARHAEDRKDIVSKAFEQLYKQGWCNQFPAFSDVEGMMVIITERRTQDFLRGKYRHAAGKERLLEHIAADSASGEDRSDWMVNLINLIRSVEQAGVLKVPEPDMFLEHYGLGMTHEEIAARHGSTKGNVNSIIARALKKLRKWFLERGE